jgi:hypothetical protein
MCDERAPEPFFALRNVPVLSCVYYDSETAARTATCGDVELVVCPNCALVYNRSFNPDLVDYAPGYQNPLHGSASFRTFANELAQRLVGAYQLKGGVAVEIGCGDGYFLELLLKNGMREAVGYDPSLNGKSLKRAKGRLRIVPERFEDPKLGKRIDAIICRHVFEHLPNPAGFARNLRQIVGSRNPLLYFEVPNGEWVLNSLSIWDVIYEHFTYWCPATLRTLFAQAGFTPLSVSIGFGDQFLMLEARPGVSPSGDWPSQDEVVDIMDRCDHFAKVGTKLISYWRTTLRDVRARQQTAALWGAGSKGVTFANLIAGDEALLAGIVDINPGKHGKYVGGCGQRVSAPAELKELRPDLILIMNDNYRAEVSAQLSELGLKSEIRHIGRGLSGV